MEHRWNTDQTGEGEEEKERTTDDKEKRRKENSIDPQMTQKTQMKTRESPLKNFQSSFFICVLVRQLGIDLIFLYHDILNLMPLLLSVFHPRLKTVFILRVSYSANSSTSKAT